MTRLSSSLDNRLTMKNFSLYETRIPKTTFKEKLNKVLSSSLSDFKAAKIAGWRSRSVIATQTKRIIKKSSLKIEMKEQSPSPSPPKMNLKRSNSVNVKSQSPTKLKFHQIEIEQEDLQFRKKEKNVQKQLSNWKNRNSFLRTMIPPLEYIPPPPPPKIPKVPVQKERIDGLIENLRINIEYFWNIYQNIPKMTNLLKSLQGYNVIVNSVLFKNNEITRIESEESLQKYFEIYKNEEERCQDFVEKDAKIYTALLFFNLRMQQKADTIQRQFMDRGNKGMEQNIKIIEEQNLKVSRFAQSETKYETLQFLADQRSYITNFKKKDAIHKLQELGIKISINEKIKDKVLTNRQLLSSSHAQPLLETISPYVIHTSKF